jgi:plastocyanin
VGGVTVHSGKSTPAPSAGQGTSWTPPTLDMYIRVAGVTPANMTPHMGDHVRFVNGDQGVVHDWAWETWHTGALQPGQSYTTLMFRSGTFTFHCLIHPQLTATITVSDQQGRLTCNSHGCTMTWG